MIDTLDEPAPSTKPIILPAACKTCSGEMHVRIEAKEFRSTRHPVCLSCETRATRHPAHRR